MRYAMRERAEIALAVASMYPGGDYFEFGNASGAFERQVVSTTDNAPLKIPFNDRVVIVDKN